MTTVDTLIWWAGNLTVALLLLWWIGSLLLRLSGLSAIATGLVLLLWLAHSGRVTHSPDQIGLAVCFMVNGLISWLVGHWLYARKHHAWRSPLAAKLCHGPAKTWHRITTTRRGEHVRAQP